MKKVLAFLLLSALPLFGGMLINSYRFASSAGITFDSANTPAYALKGTNPAATTRPHTQGSLTNGYIVVGIVTYSSIPPTVSVTYDGTAMTQIASAAGLPSHARLFGLAVGSKAGGTYNAVVTWGTSGAGENYELVGVSSFSGVNQSTPVGTAGTATGTSTAPTVNVSSATGEVVIGIVYVDGDAGSITLGAGQTQRWSLIGNLIMSTFSTEPGSGTVTTSFTTPNVLWSIAAIPLKP